MRSTNCLFCKHLQPGMKCAAFPSGIPLQVVDGRHNHDDAFPGDGGIRFDPLSDDEIKARLAARLALLSKLS